MRNISIIQCYAPTEAFGAKEKETLTYDQLDAILPGVLKGTIAIVMGDLNANVSPDSISPEHVMGKHGLGDRSGNPRFTVGTLLEP